MNYILYIQAVRCRELILLFPHLSSLKTNGMGVLENEYIFIMD